MPRKKRPEPLREQVRVALGALVAAWVAERMAEVGCEEHDALAEIATRASIGGSKTTAAQKASNVRRLLDGRVGMTYETADALACAIGARLSIFID